MFAKQVCNPSLREPGALKQALASRTMNCARSLSLIETLCCERRRIPKRSCANSLPSQPCTRLLGFKCRTLGALGAWGESKSAIQSFASLMLPRFAYSAPEKTYPSQSPLSRHMSWLPLDAANIDVVRCLLQEASLNKCQHFFPRTLLS